MECGGYAHAIQPELDYPAPPEQLIGTGSFSVILECGFVTWLLEELQRPGSLVWQIHGDQVGLAQPDETFFQAVLLNTEWCNRHIHFTLHYSWIDSAAIPTYALSDSDISSLSPAVLTLESTQGSRLRELMAATGFDVPNATEGVDLHRTFFARKFRLPESASLLEEIDSLLEAGKRRAAGIDGWQKLPGSGLSLNYCPNNFFRRCSDGLLLGA